MMNLCLLNQIEIRRQNSSSVFSIHTDVFTANMDLLITRWRTQPVTDLMEFDSFHWRVPHTAVRHSEQHKQAKTNCPLCLLTGSNISYGVFLAFFLCKYSKLIFSPSLSYLLLITTSNSFIISHSSAFPHFYLLLIPHPAFFHFFLEVWYQGSSSVFPLFLGINQGKRENIYLDLPWSNPSFSCCTSDLSILPLLHKDLNQIHLSTNSTHAPIITYTINRLIAQIFQSLFVVIKFPIFSLSSCFSCLLFQPAVIKSQVGTTALLHKGECLYIGFT